ncbi:MAG: DUF2027 domain-containing protein [Bacteroidaceae bacterium]
MKIGDKVRFLSEVGGGRISGFQGKDIVLVEDEDGFEIPMLRKEVVVVDDSEYDIGKVNTGEHTALSKGAKNTPRPKDEDSELEPADKPITFKPKAQERKGGDSLNLYLSFVPDNVKEISVTGIEAYMVNDSNYYVQVLILKPEGGSWTALFNGVAEPNSKLFVTEVERTELASLERLCIQTLAWKQDKAFMLKPALSTELRIDCTKFYKLHTFHPDEFFRDPCWTISVVKDDKPARTVFADAEQIKEALLGVPPTREQKPMEPRNKVSKPNARPEETVVDLHAQELLDTTDGLSNGDILMVQMKEFRKVMDENLKKKGHRIVFIHGKGEGVLRKNILQELKYRYKQCSVQDASFKEYGYGATLVQIG